MPYYSVDEIKEVLNKNQYFKRKLYCRGFLITTDKTIKDNSYPFYGMWKKTQINDHYIAYVHPDNRITFKKEEDCTYFIIGHAYNPFSMLYREEEILEELAAALHKNEKDYWDKESELTGVFCIGFIKNNRITFATDCTGMQLIFYGIIEKRLYITSHSKLVADLCGCKQTEYIQRLINSKFYHYWGTFLPGDISPFSELKRVVPNFKYLYKCTNLSISHERFFPTKTIEQIEDEKTKSKFEEIASIMRNNLSLIAKKWPERAAISVTGGRDSTATLASAKDVYGEMKYFSYQSKESEAVDAKAAHEICDKIGLEHKIYNISNNDADYKDIEIYRKILECNVGCIGPNNRNDVRKRAYFDKNNDFDIEVKSWVSELGRGEAQNKYNTKRWPKKPSPGYYRCMWKVILDPYLIYKSNQIFRNYLDEYYDEKTLEYLPWTDYFYWEFSWSSGEGAFLTAEHRLSYDITIPYNNRKLLEMFFSIPLEMRIDNQIPIKIIDINNRAIKETGVLVKNIAHTNLWSAMIRFYLRVFSKLGV